MEIKSSFYCGLLVVIVTISYAAGDEEKRKLKLILDRLDKVKDAEHIFKTDITFDKVDGEEVQINGQVVQSVDLDDEYKVNMEILHSSEKEGEYIKIFGIANKGVCHVMANQYKKYFYDNLKDYANAPDPDKCPVTQETYVGKDYPFDSSKFQKFLLPGFYKIVTSLMHQEEEVLQYIFEGHTVDE